MALILSLETATDVCSVALHRDGILLKELLIRMPQAHASQLSPMIRDVFAATGEAFSALRAVAVSSGPGSYTGLRIGASTAKGICFAIGIPLLAVPTLDILSSLASRENNERAWLCPMIDARRMEVYCQIQDADQNLVHPVHARIIDGNSFAELLDDRKLLVFGNGSAKCRAVLTHGNFRFADEVVPTAGALGELAYRKWSARDFENLEMFTPFYLKEFVAKTPSSLI